MTELKIFVLQHGVYYLLYLVLVLVNLYLIKKLIEVPLRVKMSHWKNGERLRRSRSKFQDKKSFESLSPFLKHIHLLVDTVSNDKGEKAYGVLSFFFISGFLFVLTFVFLFMNMNDIILTILISLFAASIPYLVLQVKLKGIRNSVGNELLTVIQQLTQNYNACNYDMYRALIATSNQIDEKALRHVFYRIISDIQVSRGEEDIRRCIQRFIFTAGNSWAKRLGNIILKGYLYDERVMNALINLSSQMENTEKMLEEEKSEALDSVVNGFFVPIIFVSSIGLGYYVSGPQDWVQLQFGESVSTLTFSLSLTFTVLSVFIALLLRNPKNDI
ncbi:hypothetical protein [Desertibacillus haloalkaliphilus]|uniref:hypothetical protein n=1 Tax=Desertibacillus haloalkaliphilus TaxID=1328930 RepID=UPI001C25E014|nr:hypothetical protein [Desertibacillus haloalkaliphilus]MBU8908057.1 hypothetical protein [Desertibacillus haloalkaliphilus]